MSVDIVMATYNGARFVKEQIASIQNQSFTDWRLLISDDNSNDDTITIIKEMMQGDERIQLINIKRQGGVIRNFSNALSEAETDYILLADQDDIWQDDRLEKLVEKIKKLDSANDNLPKMIFTDLTLVDEDNNVIADSFYRSNKINPTDNLTNYNLLWRSTVYGCTCILNKKLLNIALPIPEYAHMHDQWLALMAKKYDGLYFYDFSSIRYRQHSTNAVGGKNKNLFQKFSAIQKNIMNIDCLVDRTIVMIKNNQSLFKDNVMQNKKDYVKFALQEVLPWVFKGNKKIFSLFVLIRLLIKR